MISVDDIIEASKKASTGEWRIRKTVDDTGDYPFPTYDIISIHEYGPEGIGTAFQNPYNAILFAGSAMLVDEILRLRAEVIGLKGSYFFKT